MPYLALRERRLVAVGAVPLTSLAPAPLVLQVPLEVAEPVGDLLQLVQLDFLADRLPSQLSNGQRQRVALARALVGRPRLLILDDATSSVDPAVEAAILRGLREAELPSTIVLIAYRPASIALADEVIYVERGRVVARGSHAQLLERVPGYQRMLTAYDHEPGFRQDSLRESRIRGGGDP